VSTKIVVKHNHYRDSVFLMVIDQQARTLRGVHETAVMMGTDNNKDIIREVGFSGADIDSASPNDLILCVRGQSDSAVEAALAQMEEMLTRKPTPRELEDEYKTLDAALRERPSCNLALISVPGQFAAREARKALHRGLNVLLFSDNVTLDEEVELKRLALSLDRIVMGPDCGTAIINQVPLAFANAVPPGPIGIVAASGTGLQEVVCQLAGEGLGITQAVGVGGRDLSDGVGGISTIKALEVLEEDAATRVIVVVSKPPGPATMERMLQRISESDKEVIVCFLGADIGVMSRRGVAAAGSLEEAARMAACTVKGVSYTPRDFTFPKEKIESIVARETRHMAGSQRFVRGLYSGGTLCYEAMIILSGLVGDVYSNIPLKDKLWIPNPPTGVKHTCIDLGDDYFTKGKPHPMIAPETRNRYIREQAADEEVGVLLLDVVLGYGSHRDMAGALSESIRAAKSSVETRGGYLSVIASVCGTAEDPQGLDSQVEKLESCGVVVMPSNAQAARLAAMVLKAHSVRGAR